MAAITSAANTAATEMEMISRIVQTELLENTVVMPTVMDYSSMVEPGIKSLEIPRFEADQNAGSGRFGGPEAQNADGVTEAALKTATLTTDKIDLDQWVNLSYRIPDRVRDQSRVPLEAELARKAGREMAIYMDQQIINTLDASTTTLAFNDTTNEDLELVDITAARRILNRNNVPQDDRYLLVSPEKEEDMLNIENFIHADKYGAREALLNGEIGRVYGFRVIVSNLLSQEQVFAYHREAVGFAVQKQVQFETDRPSVTLQVTDYGYSAGWGYTHMYDSKKCVKFVETP